MVSSSLYYGYEDDLSTADLIVLTPGERFHVPVGMRHQMVALNDTELFEFSTQHFDSDSYRVIKVIERIDELVIEFPNLIPDEWCEVMIEWFDKNPQLQSGGGSPIIIKTSKEL